MRTKYRRYLGLFILPVLLLVPAGALNWLFLDNAGELTDIADVARIQQQEGGLYGTALHPNSYPYKLELLRARRPDVAMIGSSRVLEFRQGAFSRPFANLGRTINYPAEAVALVDDMLEIHKPELVLFGVDHYWLNPAYTTAPNFDSHGWRGGDLSPNALVMPWRWLSDGKITGDSYARIIAGDVPVAANDAPLIGVRAILDGAGFGPDGSMYYDHFVYGRRTAEDVGFRDTLGRIQTGTRQFRYGRDIKPERVRDLQTAVDRLTRAGVKVVVFVPPMAPRALDAIEAAGDGYAYVGAAREAIANLGVPVFDFYDPAAIGAGDCEFIDAFHAGDVVSARMLLAMADNPATALDSALNRANLRSRIDLYAGNAQADRRFAHPGEREVDFLAIGCEKTSR